MHTYNDISITFEIYNWGVACATKHFLRVLRYVYNYTDVSSEIAVELIEIR